VVESLIGTARYNPGGSRTVYLAGCYGASSAAAANTFFGSSGYHAPPASDYDKDDLIDSGVMLDRMVEQLKRLEDKPCCRVKKVCIFAGPQK
jgi:hypothetical protein